MAGYEAGFVRAEGGIFEADLYPEELAVEQARLRALDELPPLPGDTAHARAVIARLLQIDPVSEGYLVWLLAMLAECCEALGDRAEAHHFYVRLRDAQAKQASRSRLSCETAEPYDDEHTRDRGSYLDDYYPPGSAWHKSHAGRVPAGLIAERIARCRPAGSSGEGHKCENRKPAKAAT